MQPTTAKRMRGLSRPPHLQAAHNLNQVVRVLPMIAVAATDLKGQQAVALLSVSARAIAGGLACGGEPCERARARETVREFVPRALAILDCIDRAPSDYMPHPIDIAKAELRNALMYCDCDGNA